MSQLSRAGPQGQEMVRTDLGQGRDTANQSRARAGQGQGKAELSTPGHDSVIVELRPGRTHCLGKQR